MIVYKDNILEKWMEKLVHIVDSLWERKPIDNDYVPLNRLAGCVIALIFSGLLGFGINDLYIESHFTVEFETA